MNLTWSLLSFRGRINRAKWWLMHLLVWGILIFISMIFSVLDDTRDLFGFKFLLFIPFGIFFIWSRFAINVKRWHDRDKSAWWLLIELIPLIGSIWAFIELGCLKGIYGKNRFGPDPLEYS